MPAPAHNTKEMTVLITGATDGLGKEVALRLAAQNCDLILHGRNREKGKALLDLIVKETGNRDARFYPADFAEIRQIDGLAEEIIKHEKRLNVLVNNAGVGMEKSRSTSADGIELTFQVNYLATYVLSRKLIPLLEASAPSRIVNVSSIGQVPIDFSDPLLEKNWTGMQAYRQSKLAQIMCTIDMAEEVRAQGITVNALHPATFMPTKIVQGMFPVQSTLDDGVEAVLNLVLNPKLDGVTGKYFDRLSEAEPNRQALDGNARASLRELTDHLLAGNRE